MLELINTPFTFYSLSPLQPPPWWLVRVCEKSIGRCLTRDRLTVRDCMYPCGWVAAGPWCLAKQRTVSTRAQISGDLLLSRFQQMSSQVKSSPDVTGHRGPADRGHTIVPGHVVADAARPGVAALSRAARRIASRALHCRAPAAFIGYAHACGTRQQLVPKQPTYSHVLELT